MKRVLKIIKYLGILIISLLAIGTIYLAITGFPKPSSITTENIDRLPFSYLADIKNTSNEFSKFLRPAGWSKEDKEGMYVRFASGTSIRMGFLDKVNKTPQPIEAWPNVRPIFPKESNQGYFLYLKDNTKGQENNQIYKFDINTNESTLLTNGEDRYSSPRFIPNSSKILFSKRSKEDTNYDLYTMDINEPKSEALVYENQNEYSEEGSIYIDDFSPDGSQVALRLGYYNTVPAILNISTGELKVLQKKTEALTSNTYHEWSADGSKLYYASSKDADFSQLRVRDLSSDADSILVKGINWDVSNVTESPDGNWLVFNVNEDGTYRLFFYHLPTGKTQKFDKLNNGSIPYAFFKAGEDSTIGFPINYFSGETDIYSYNINTEALTQWTDNKVPTDLLDPEVIHYPTFDFDSLKNKQREISAVYYKPTQEFTEPFPVIIELHGGPNMQFKTEFDPLVNLHLKKGIAVIAPNFRGSRGYGFKFMNMDYGKGRMGAIKDVGALLDWIKTQDELDHNRVIVSGGSYGGYLSLATASHYSDRLLGAIDYFGITDLVTFLEGDKNAERKEEYGNVKDSEMRGFLKTISPLHNVENINIPLFIFQGEQDTRVLVDQSRRLVESLKKSSKEYIYIESATSGHLLPDPWTIAYTKTAELKFIDDLFFQQ